MIVSWNGVTLASVEGHSVRPVALGHIGNQIHRFLQVVRHIAAGE